MSRPVPAGDYVAHFDPQLAHHRAWLLAVLERLVAHEPQALEEGGSLRQLWSVPPAEPLAVAAVAAAAPVTDRSNEVALALPLVQQFEGCQLSAYPDPETGAEPWTIGWGSTSYADGTPVQAGDTIGQEQADALLAGRLERDGAWLAQRIPGWAALSSHQQAALLSFTYNCGPNWFGSNGFATLSRCLQQGELEQVPAALLLYINPGGPSEAGLRRRRKAEAALWCTSPTPAKPPLPGGGISPPALGASGCRHANPLVGVPHFQQRDSAQLSQRDRTCFSSSCAMLLEALKPGTLRGANGDDHYLEVVQRYGDTTDANTQLQALAHYGVTALLVQTADFELIEEQIARGIPVPCGYIHRGPIDRPTGTGHWLIVYGHTPTHLVVNDPWGEPDLLSGATLNANGMGLQFSRQNFGKRWMVEPIGAGVYRYAPGKGWAVVVDGVG
jgi:GH24 family phage-related lysozyme (muramidase)